MKKPYVAVLVFALILGVVAISGCVGNTTPTTSSTTTVPTTTTSITRTSESSMTTATQSAGSQTGSIVLIPGHKYRYTSLDASVIKNSKKIREYHQYKYTMTSTVWANITFSTTAIVDSDKFEIWSIYSRDNNTYSLLVRIDLNRNAGTGYATVQGNTVYLTFTNINRETYYMTFYGAWDIGK